MCRPDVVRGGDQQLSVDDSVMDERDDGPLVPTPARPTAGAFVRDEHAGLGRDQRRRWTLASTRKFMAALA